jgi:hypothetical protein
MKQEVGWRLITGERSRIRDKGPGIIRERVIAEPRNKTRRIGLTVTQVIGRGLFAGRLGEIIRRMMSQLCA